MKNLLPYHGEVFLYNDFFTKQESDLFYRDLIDHVNWEQLPIKIFGKEVLQPRLTAWYADSGKRYAYSGLTLQAAPWNSTLLHIKERLAKISAVPFNSALLNLYRDGKDSMGWHRDNEKELGASPVIASVSFGATRKFQLREYAGKGNLISLNLLHGSVLIMGGESQQFWEHRVPKTSGVLDSRINVTFRYVH